MKPIKNDNDYNNALSRAYELMQMDLQPETTESDELEILSIIIDEYERKYFPIELPDPIEAIKFRMEQSGINNKELVEILGYKSRVSEIFSKKRKLSLDMIRKLHNKLNIPLEVLIKAY